MREATPFCDQAARRRHAALRHRRGREAVPRLTPLEWAGHEHAGDELVHKLKDGRYLKHWFVAVAEKIARPKGIGTDEPWVHVNIDQQTLVAYRGDEPVYATLVSSGLPGHDTPLGLFEIRAKYVASTMSDIGADADDRYSIEDVPWTQFFSGSIALHGAFWHGGSACAIARLRELVAVRCAPHLQSHLAGAGRGLARHLDRQNGLPRE